VVTQVEVDKNDPGFTHPTKPIGAFFSEAQRDELQRRTRTGILLRILAGAIAAWWPHRSRCVLLRPMPSKR
jgi:hypothetical protein